MTQYPQDPGSFPPSEPAGRLNKMALVSFILGILSLPLGILILMPICGLILGIIGLVKINSQPQAFGGKGFAIAGIVMNGLGLLVTPVIALMIAILLPSLGKARELSNRSVCAANLRGITQSMVVYSNDNSDALPITKTPGRNVPYTLSVPSITGSSNADVTITRSMYDGPGTNNPPQNMWIMVLNGQVSSKQFICRSDPASTIVANATDPASGNFFTTFNDGRGASNLAYSYSFAYPLNSKGEVGGWWRNATDASLPLIADMCPTGAGVTTSLPGSKTGNSKNHQGDGQTVAFGDGHAEFTRRADIGQDNDNIYTSNGGRASSGGIPYSGATALIVGGGAGAYDICLVPCADISTGARK